MHQSYTNLCILTVAHHVSGLTHIRYESIQTETNPTSKSGGQMGTPETQSQDSKSTTAAMANDAQSQSSSTSSGDTEKYEEKVASGGVGGRTSDNGGSADADGGGFAGTSAENSRSTEGYGGDQDMDKTVGG